MIFPVRTTVDLDADVLQSAKEIAAHRGITAGQVISELVRKALREDRPTRRVRNGVPLLSRGSASAPLVTTSAVNTLLDED